MVLANCSNIAFRSSVLTVIVPGDEVTVFLTFNVKCNEEVDWWITEFNVLEPARTNFAVS